MALDPIILFVLLLLLLLLLLPPPPPPRLLPRSALRHSRSLPIMAFKSPLFTQLNGFASHEDKVNRAFPIKSVTDVAADRPQGAGLFARFAFAGAVCVSAGRKTGGLGGRRVCREDAGSASRPRGSTHTDNTLTSSPSPLLLVRYHTRCPHTRRCRQDAHPTRARGVQQGALTMVERIAGCGSAIVGAQCSQHSCLTLPVFLSLFCVQGMITAFRQVVAKEGSGALLTGFGPTAAGYFLQGAFKFGG